MRRTSIAENTIKRILAVCIAGIFSGGALAADLMQVYQDAVANDAKFSAARAQFEAGQEKVVQGRAGLLPQGRAPARSSLALRPMPLQLQSCCSCSMRPIRAYSCSSSS